jgi:U4/U6.U5 tri-snRNP-associated protein 2
MEKLDSNGITELPTESIETSKEENLRLHKKRKRDEKLENSIVDSHKIQCPYLGTVKRHLLDFDFEKVCSISLSNMNVYACLCCGKYFQGRGTKTHAYTHSLEENHHMLINLSDRKIFTLPDNYEVLENSLLDIKVNLKPFYTDEEIKKLDFTTKFSNLLTELTFCQVALA